MNAKAEQAEHPQTVEGRPLTEAQRRHLRELAEAGEYGNWRPRHYGEQRCADALNARGLIRREYVSGMGRMYVITDAGKKAVAR